MASLNQLLQSLPDFRLQPCNAQGYSVNGMGAFNLVVYQNPQKPDRVFLFSVLGLVPAAESPAVRMRILEQLLSFNLPAFNETPWRYALTRSGNIVLNQALRTDELTADSLSAALSAFSAALPEASSQVQAMLSEAAADKEAKPAADFGTQSRSTEPESAPATTQTQSTEQESEASSPFDFDPTQVLWG